MPFEGKFKLLIQPAQKIDPTQLSFQPIEAALAKERELLPLLQKAESAGLNVIN